MVVLLLCGSAALVAQSVYRGDPVITAHSLQSEYQVGGQWYTDYWSIAPEVEHDTLPITCFHTVEDFTFKTDQDEISFSLRPGEVKSFYVLVQDSLYAHTLVQGVASPIQEVAYGQAKRNKAHHISYQREPSPFLDSLRSLYPLQAILAKERSAIDQVLSILNWTHHQWEHSGNFAPSRNDAITILREAGEGKQFPCFAYAIVLRDQLRAHGFPARTIYLKSKHAATQEYSPGHVATEVYIKDLQKWVYLDGQFNIMPQLDGRPLHAVEFQHALATRYADLKLLSQGEVNKRAYTEFVYEYLYYLDTALDHRLPTRPSSDKDGKRSLMLVPIGAKNLEHINFWNMNIDYCKYTHSLKDFYARPKL